MYAGLQGTHDVLYTYKRVHSPCKPGYMTHDKLNQIRKSFSSWKSLGNRVGLNFGCWQLSMRGGRASLGEGIYDEGMLLKENTNHEHDIIN